MGKSNTIVKRWLSDKKRSADLFNAEVFSGKQIVQPEDLEMIPGESNIIIKDKNGKEKLVTRYRDIMMRWKYGIDFLILAIENQDKVHYTMPVRNMVYDGLAYTEQIEQLWKQHVDNEDEVTDAEYLSRFKKEDKLNPVITLVFYYGDEPWDGETDIYGMLGLNEKFSEINEVQKFIPNYHINLVDISKISNIDNYISDLQHVFNMIQFKSNKEGFFQYLNKYKTYFEKIDDDSYQMIKILLRPKKWLEQVKNEEPEGERNMCKALEDFYMDGVEEGREKEVRFLIIKNHNAGLADEVIAAFLDKSVDFIRKIISEEKQKVNI